MARYLSHFFSRLPQLPHVHGQRPRLTGGENAHLLPVICKLGTAIKAHYISSRLRCSFTTALSPFAGLGETDAFVPASEQSVKNLHNLLPWLLLILKINNLRNNLGPFRRSLNSQGSAPLYLLDSAGNPIFVSLDFIKYMTKNVMYLWIQFLLSVRLTQELWICCIKIRNFMPEPAGTLIHR